MNDITPANNLTDSDSAWASINTPLSVDELKNFCRDIIRLYRINPMLEFKETTVIGENEYSFSGKNISHETAFDFEFNLKARETENGFEVIYDKGIKSSTDFSIEATGSGSRLTITERYDRLSEAERKAHLGEVDKSLTNWAEYLQRFIIMWKKWSRFGLWRWYMRAVWQPMKPMARRITYMLLWITLVEVALITLGVGIYFSEFG
ncbi:MAG: hypothetical protein ACC635_04960 [Acidiferrobacterales bacterium]